METQVQKRLLESDPYLYQKLYIEKQVPSQSDSNERKRELQRQRSREFGIRALEDGTENLTFPAGNPRDLRLYGDPVNLKYPIDTLGRANNARARLKQAAGQQSYNARELNIIHERIVRRQLQLGANPSYNPDDRLDRALPSDLRDRLQR